MARSYSSKLVALTTGVSQKWLDNLLSHLVVPGVTTGRQGVRREINDDGLLAVELTRILVGELGVSVQAAVDLASRAIRSRSEAEAQIAAGSAVTLVFHLAAVEQRLRAQMVQAVESVAHVRRGRRPALWRPRSRD